MGQLHLPLHSAPILLFSELKMMRTQVAIVFFLAVAALAEESIISYDAEDHKHEQSGDAGNAVQGSYSHTDAEGNTYTVTYGYGVAHPFNYGYAYNHHGFPYVY